MKILHIFFLLLFLSALVPNYSIADGTISKLGLNSKLVNAPCFIKKDNKYAPKRGKPIKGHGN